MTDEQRDFQNLGLQVHYKTFQSRWSSWSELFKQAADFATALGPHRLINISHSEGPSREGVVTVWYWGEAWPEDKEVGEQ